MTDDIVENDEIVYFESADAKKRLAEAVEKMVQDQAPKQEKEPE